MKSTWRQFLLLLLVIVLTAGATPAVAGETAAPDAEESIESAAAPAEAPVGLDDALRAELQVRSAQYDGNYAGTGDRSSTFRVHWPTVIIIAALIIIL